MFLPKKGKILPNSSVVKLSEIDYAATIANALHEELGQDRHAAKTAMAWTGASERTTKNWLAGTNGPSGLHLVGLAQHSDAVFEVFLLMAGRRPTTPRVKLRAMRKILIELIPYLDDTDT